MTRFIVLILIIVPIAFLYDLMIRRQVAANKRLLYLLGQLDVVKDEITTTYDIHRLHTIRNDLTLVYGNNKYKEVRSQVKALILMVNNKINLIENNIIRE